MSPPHRRSPPRRPGRSGLAARLVRRQRGVPLPRPAFAVLLFVARGAAGRRGSGSRRRPRVRGGRGPAARSAAGRLGGGPRADELQLLPGDRPAAARHRRGDRFCRWWCSRRSRAVRAQRRGGRARRRRVACLPTCARGRAAGLRARAANAALFALYIVLGQPPSAARGSTASPPRCWTRSSSSRRSRAGPRPGARRPGGVAGARRRRLLIGDPLRVRPAGDGAAIARGYALLVSLLRRPRRSSGSWCSVRRPAGGLGVALVVGGVWRCTASAGSEWRRGSGTRLRTTRGSQGRRAALRLPVRRRPVEQRGSPPAARPDRRPSAPLRTRSWPVIAGRMVPLLERRARAERDRSPRRHGDLDRLRARTPTSRRTGAAPVVQRVATREAATASGGVGRGERSSEGCGDSRPRLESSGRGGVPSASSTRARRIRHRPFDPGNSADAGPNRSRRSIAGLRLAASRRSSAPSRSSLTVSSARRPRRLRPGPRSLELEAEPPA